MPRKVRRDMQCAFCVGGGRGPYLELEVTLPDVVGWQRQLLGAHADCLSNAMVDGNDIELDLLADPEEMPSDG